MKEVVENLLARSLQALAIEPPERDSLAVERSRNPEHGDFASNAALVLAAATGERPRALAERIRAALPPSELVAKTEIAGPGFLNFFLAPAAWQAELARILAAGESYGRSEAGSGRRVLLEFVSANPTGPL
ncbi:MAG TPA: arginine--tRNA ligase, partial [Gammaproteobacteria bacterium]|nr:arginine--tRNA ligase [Gammaproteobacteria bacterium]